MSAVNEAGVITCNTRLDVTGMSPYQSKCYKGLNQKDLVRNTNLSII